MLAPDTVAVIKQTVPVLVAHGELLTRHFYRRMFTHSPEVRPFFNPAHQHSGSQQAALAAAICAYAQNIENPAALAGAVELIAQKHCSLGIQPEHYPIVGKHLLASIREVLGDAATPAILDAWAAAYGLLADILINREAEIYAHHDRAHGFRGFRPFRVLQKTQESTVITSFHLAPVDGAPVRPFLPGQYVTVRLPSADGASTTMRNYSLSARPGLPYYRISVKRESAPGAQTPAGHVSNYLHDQIQPGDAIDLAPPCGEFTLATDPADRPLVLLSAGVGITPVLAMLHHALAENPARQIHFLHAAVNGQTHAFRKEVLALADRHPNLSAHFRYSAPTRDDLERELCDGQGFFDTETLRTLLPTPDAPAYFCGPKPFMLAVRAALLALGAHPTDLHYEFFGPAQSLQPAPAPVST